jgi:hypothetical protein
MPISPEVFHRGMVAMRQMEEIRRGVNVMIDRGGPRELYTRLRNLNARIDELDRLLKSRSASDGDIIWRAQEIESEYSNWTSGRY